MRPDKTYPEATGYSVSMGLIMAVIFSAAAAYLGLKVGQVFEAAIPIAIIAAGIAGVTKRKNSLGENVIIQSIGAASGIVVAGAIFTLPALYILQAKYPAITVNFLEVFLSSLLGGLLGILFFIPFRKYFVKDMHGKFPFPEATATTQVLISGQKGGSQAKPLLMAGFGGRSVRLLPQHIRLVERGAQHTGYPCAPNFHPQHQDDVQHQHRLCCARFGLHRGPSLRFHHFRW